MLKNDLKVSYIKTVARLRELEKTGMHLYISF